VEVTDEADLAFVSALEGDVAAWLEAGAAWEGEEGDEDREGEGGEEEEGANGSGADEMVLPPTSAYRRLLTYQVGG
jgi:hypothetical protein